MHWSIEHGMVVRRVGVGPRVVWIHGLGESSVSFDPIVGMLPGYAHVLVDLPGYGRSPWPDLPAPGLVDVADELASWLVGDPPAVVIGHSMGGVLATLVAERTPVGGIVDVDGNLLRGDCTYSAIAASQSLDEFVASGFAELCAAVYADGVARPELRGYHAAMRFCAPHVFHRHAIELVELSTGGALAPRLAALAVPKLFVAGVPGGIGAASRALLDHHGVPWLGIEPAGHWVHLDQPDRVSAALVTFLGRC